MIFKILLFRSVHTPNSDKNCQTSCPLQTFVCNISRHLEFIIEQGHRVNWVSRSLDSRVTGSLGHKMWPSSISGVWLMAKRIHVLNHDCISTNRDLCAPLLLSDEVHRCTWGDSDVISIHISVQDDFCRHLVGKTVRTVCHCDIAFVGTLMIIRTF